MYLADRERLSSLLVVGTVGKVGEVLARLGKCWHGWGSVGKVGEVLAWLGKCWQGWGSVGKVGEVLARLGSVGKVGKCCS